MKRKKYKMGELIYDFSVKAKDFEGFNGLEFFGVSNDRGIISAKYASQEKIEDYKIIEQGCFAYNPYRINVGSIAYVEKDMTGLISPAYVVFKANEELVVPYLLFKFLKSKEGLRQISFWGRGTVREALRFNDLSKMEIELPEIEEQKRLYEKIQACELLAGKMDKEIDTQLSLLTALRQAILTEAVQGKLTAQWRKENPNQEPAGELLKRIAAEKARLIKEKKISKEKPLPPITAEDVPYEVPEGWVWCRLQDLVNVGTGSTPSKANPAYYNGNIPWYTSSATGDLFAKLPEQFISELALKETNCKVFPSGTLIVAMYGQGKTRGQVSELILPGATNQALAAMVFFESSAPSKNYIKYYFRKIYHEIRELAEGGAQPNLNVFKIKSTLIPIPPLPEQHAIVQKVNTLLAYYDELEQQVQQSKADLDLLMQSVLGEVFGVEHQALGSKATKTRLSAKETLMPNGITQPIYEGNTLNMELLEILQQQPEGKITAVNLWKMSKYQKDIDAFYEALKREVEEKKTIKEADEKGWLELVAS